MANGPQGQRRPADTIGLGRNGRQQEVGTDKIGQGGSDSADKHAYAGTPVGDSQNRSGCEVGLMAAPYSAKSIANEFIKRNGGPMEQMKLQKLVYLAHGWNLAISRTPLILDRIQAWDGGPVIRQIWNHLRDYGYNAPNFMLGDPSNKIEYVAELNPTEISVVDHVWRKYQGYTGIQLSQATHEPGTPWSNAYFGSGRNSVIQNTDIQNHFIELAIAGRTNNN